MGLTAASLGADINDQTAMKNWLAKPVQNNQQVFEMVRSYHRAITRPEMYNLVLQLEAALKTVDETVLKARPRAAVAFGRQSSCPKAPAWTAGFDLWVAEFYEAGPASLHGGLNAGAMLLYSQLPEVPRLRRRPNSP